MKETGILFTPENIRAIREGRKVQTRRVIPVHGEGMHYGKKLNEWALSSPPFQITEDLLPLWHWRGSKPAKIGDFAQEIQTDVDDFVTLPIPFRYGVAGDRLYLKEGVIVDADFNPPELVGYYMDGARAITRGEKRLTAMFMPKWAARTWLELTEVRVERLQDISEEDAIAEGITIERVIVGVHCYGGPPIEEHADRSFFQGGDEEGYESPVDAYAHLWDSLNKKKHPWSSNPWTWVLEFQILESTTKR